MDLWKEREFCMIYRIKLTRKQIKRWHILAIVMIVIWITLIAYALHENSVDETILPKDSVGESTPADIHENYAKAYKRNAEAALKELGYWDEATNQAIYLTKEELRKNHDEFTADFIYGLMERHKYG